MTGMTTGSDGDSLRWGFLGTGAIAALVADDLVLVEGATWFAVASRTADRAATFAAAQGFERSYGSYAELLADPEVDVVYVATPHAQHHAVTSAVLAAGKPVLVEKAFTCTAAAARDLVEQATAAGVFMMEAMWTRFVPTIVQVRQWLADDAVGRVRQVQADLGFVAPYDPAHRLFDPAQGGGALLDLGVYPVSFAQLVLGAPSTVHALGVLAENGVDVEGGLLLGHADGAQAVLSVSLTSDLRATRSSPVPRDASPSTHASTTAPVRYWSGPDTTRSWPSWPLREGVTPTRWSTWPSASRRGSPEV